MKTRLYSTLTLLILAMLTFLPNSFAQDTNLESVVRVIYFIPNDRKPDPDIDAKLDSMMKDIQQFYADQMESHGFGRKTFRLETDPSGKTVIHHVNGKFNESDYYNEPGTFIVSKVNAIEEIETRFDKSKNIYIIMLDISINFGGFARVDGQGGLTVISSANNDAIFVTAHELGHAFGLGHDFRSDKYIMSYTRWKPSLQLSYCNAERLSVHPYFNAGRGQSNLSDSPTTIQMLPATASPSNAIRLRFEVTDPDGLHQAQLFSPFGDWGIGNQGPSLTACKRLNGNVITVEFETTELVHALPNSYAALRVVDVNGNFTSKAFEIDNLSSLLTSKKTVSIPDKNLEAVVRETLDLAPEDVITELDMLRLRLLKASERQISDLTGIKYAKSLRNLDLSRNQISDITPLAGLKYLVQLNLNTNQISDITPLKGLTNLDICYLRSNQIRDITPLTGLIDLTSLDLHLNQITDITPLTGLTNLESLYLGWNEITDITLLTKLTQLTRLDLGGHQIEDIIPLTKFTHLKYLNLSRCLIRDITPLTKLTQLEELQLSNNEISDITPLTKLTHLKYLRIYNNEISDVIPFEGLVNLKYLHLAGNPIKDREPLLVLLKKNPDIEIYLTWSGEPLPVTLSHFGAELTDTGVILNWTTESEVDNAGFNILRSEKKDSTFKVVNPTMIQGAGTTSERSTYTWTDTTAKLNIAYYYRIQDISHAGVRKDLATVRMKGFVSASGKLTTTWANLKTQN